jgi:hypothetical protein
MRAVQAPATLFQPDEQFLPPETKRTVGVAKIHVIDPPRARKQ